MTRYLRLFRSFARADLQYALEYRVNTAVELVRMVVLVATSVAAVLVLFSYTDDLNGWTLPQMLVVLGVFYLVQGVGELLFVPNFSNLMEQIRLGTLDFALLKPASSQFLVSARHLQFPEASQIALGAVVTVLGIARLGGVGPWEAGAFVVALACGFAILYALLLVIGTLSFWLVRVENLMAIYWAFLDAARFPVDIYPAWLRVSLSTVVPIGLAVTVPASAATGKLDALGLAGMLAATVAAVVFASWFWRRGLRAYTGASA